ncbi:MAG: HAMP domain-containing protein, partial [Cytophagales bacterium]|nr:HAMP domain-containing protein [Cytophagales bacterium]
EGYFGQVRTEINFYAQTQVLIGAMKAFEGAFSLMPSQLDVSLEESKLRGYYKEEVMPNLLRFDKGLVGVDSIFPKEPRSVLLQAHYLTKNKTPYKFTDYHGVHQKYHSILSTFMKTYGYYDIFLVEDKTGYIVYSVNKEIDFATSLLTGAYANTHLGQLFRQIRYSGIKSQTIMSDFGYYLPSNYMPSAFIATPIFDGETKIGTLIFQLPIHKLDAITTSNKEWKEEGYGETGECYIIGSDCRMRTNSRFVLENTSQLVSELQSAHGDANEIRKVADLKTTVLYNVNCNPTIQHALAGISGAQQTSDYRGKDVLSSFTPLKIGDVHWVLLAEIDVEEAFGPVKAFGLRSFFVVIVLTLAIILAAFFISNALSKPISDLVKSTKEIGSGNLTIPTLYSAEDELGGLIHSFNDMVVALQRQRFELFEKQDEISAQMEEITSQRDEILSKNVQLEEKQLQILKQKEDLNLLNEKISKINETLEEKVNERTLALKLQNEKLFEYAHLNSHQLRAPVATILGLLKVITTVKDPEELARCLSMLELTVQKLDETVHLIQETIDKAEYRDG